MWIFITLGSIIIISIIGYNFIEQRIHWWFKDTFGGIAVIGSFIFIVLLFAVPFCRMEHQTMIEQYHAVVETIEIARKNNDQWYENISLTTEIVGINKQLAEARYRHKIFGSVWIPSEILELERIK